MAGKGTYGAYEAAYGDQPIDTAGAGAKAFEKTTDTLIKRKDKKDADKKVQDKQDKLDAEKAENKAYTRGRHKAADLNAALGRIKLQAGSPPSAAQIATLSGTELAEIHSNYPPGIERSMRTENVTKKAKMAIDAITKAGVSLDSAPTDNFATEGGFYNTATNMLKGEYTFDWENGDLRVVGQARDKTEINMSIDEFNSTIVPPKGLKKVDIERSSEQMNEVRLRKEYDLNAVEGQTAYVRAAMGIAAQHVNANNPLAAIRYAYNNVQFDPKNAESMATKTTLLDMGRKLQSGVKFEELNPEEQQLFYKHLPKLQQQFAKQLVGQLPKATKRDGKAIGDGTDTNNNKNPLDDKEFVDLNADIITNTYRPDEADTIAESASNGDLNALKEQYPNSLVQDETKKTTLLTDKAAVIMKINWDTSGWRNQNRTGSGSFSLAGRTTEFSSWDDFKTKFSGKLQGQGADALQYFRGGEYLLETNVNKVVSNLRAKHKVLIAKKSIKLTQNKVGAMVIKQSGKIVSTINFNTQYPLPVRENFETQQEYDAAREETKGKRDAAVEIALSIL